MAIGIAAAALGAFGNGWLSRAEAVSADGSLHVRYQRFWRARLPLELRIEWLALTEQNVLFITRDYLDALAVQNVSPPPASVTVDSDRAYYEFRVRAQNTPIEVRLLIKPDRAGRHSGEIGIGYGGGATVRVEQFVFP